MTPYKATKPRSCQDGEIKKNKLTEKGKQKDSIYYHRLHAKKKFPFQYFMQTQRQATVFHFTSPIGLQVFVEPAQNISV